MRWSPYSIGLSYGWSDDALNEEGHNLLNRLANLLGVGHQTREILGNGTCGNYAFDFSRSRCWRLCTPIICSRTRILVYREEEETLMRWLGRSALDVGLTREGWKETYAWMKVIGRARIC